VAHIVLVRENYREDVPYGLALYANEAARKVIPTAENLEWFREMVGNLRNPRTAQRLDRSHHQKGRGRGCSLKRSRDQSLDIAN